jgi:uncharacterized repeat protein (TIGR03803 family)
MWRAAGGLLVATALAAPAGAVSILKAFPANPVDGTHPKYEIVADGTGYLYGTTYQGGAMNLGTIFKVKNDGSNFTLLHTFTGGATDGALPAAGLVLDGAGNLYGTTYAGGSAGGGTVFTITTSGTGYTVLHTFTGVAPEGLVPFGTLAFDDAGTLYGTTEQGGDFNGGTVFRMDTDGTDYEVLYSFGDVGDGYYPDAGLVLDGAGNLYGTTNAGGTAEAGTVFTITTSGTGYAVLHSFTGGTSDGSFPYASLVLDEAGFLYGTTYQGGASELGTVFTIKTTGADFKVLHSFGSDKSDGTYPYSALALDGEGNLFGTTVSGGSASPLGTLFTLKTTGEKFAVIHSFAGGASDGRNPYASLLLAGGILYGTSYRGGASDAGTVFAITTGGIDLVVLHSFAGAPLEGAYPRAALLYDGASTLFGTTSTGGASDLGALFSVRTDGTGFTVLHSFLGGASDGALAYAAVVSDGEGNLFGTTYQGGVNNRGTVYTIKDNGSGFAVLHSFAGGTTDGSLPYAGLVLDGSRLYGTTFRGGASDLGTVFSLQTDGDDFAVLHSFAGGTVGDGSFPRAGLVLDGDGNLYGTTYTGGATNNRGTVFTLTTEGTDFSVLHSFSPSTSDGSSPWAALLLDGDGNLYGTTSRGGASNWGTVFTLKTNGDGFGLLHSFTTSACEGAFPYAPLLLDGSGNLYGTTYEGCGSSAGTVFTLKTTGADYAMLHNFAGGASDGENPYAALVFDGAGHLYGTTSGGGAWGLGTVYSLSPLLTVSKAGNGEGAVTSSPAGIDCGSACSARFSPGTPVTLTATASAGSTFTGWSGEGCSGAGTCEVAMDQDRSVTATFTLNTYPLTVSKAGTGSGTVTSNPAGIDCGSTCSAGFNYSTVVTLSASADPGSGFTGWSGGGCAGTGECVVAMTDTRAVTATFESCTVTLSDLTITTMVDYTSCGTLTAGPAFRVEWPGSVTFRAAVRVVLANGFSVGNGATFTAGLDPSLAVP